MSFLQRIQDEAYAYDFYEILRRIECENPRRPRVGASKRPQDDPVRLGQEPSLAFAPAAVSRVQIDSAGRPPRLLVHFFGLLGPNGPLPIHLTDYARDRLRNANDPTFSRFLDVFHHRLLSFFYRIWASSHPAVSYDRPAEDRFSTYVGALFGLGMPFLRDRDALPDLAKLYNAGRLALRTRNEEGLRAVLESFFEIPFRIEPFFGHWLDIPRESILRLGSDPETGSLGRSTTLGARTWECQQKFRIVAGPLRLEEYKRLLPGGATLRRVVAAVRNYLGDELAWDMRLVLFKEDVPPLRLGGDVQLGWTTWFTSESRENDAGELVLDAAAVAV